MQGASIFGFTHSSHLNFSSKQWKIKQATNNPKQCPFHSICLTSSPLENHCGSTKSTVSRRLGGGVLQTSANWFKYFPPRNICIDDQYLYDILRGNWSFSQPEHWPHPSLSELVKPLSQQKTHQAWEENVCVDKTDFFYAKIYLSLTMTRSCQAS